MSFIKKAIESFDSTNQNFEEQKEAVKALEELGTAKAEIFIRDIESDLLSAGADQSNQTVPITYIVDSRKAVRAFSSKEVDNIGSVVTNALSSFISGKKENIINGVGSVIDNALKVFLGEGHASVDSMEMYCVATDGLSPVRIDLKAWYYSVTASSITTKMEKITVVVATKSIIDVTRIDLSTFLYLYQRQFDVNKMEPSELKAAISEAADIYNTFVQSCLEENAIPEHRANTSESDRVQYAKTLGKVKKSKDIAITFEDKRTK